MQTRTTAERLREALRCKFPDYSPEYYQSLLLPYVESELSPSHVLPEIETGDEGKFWSCAWEAMLHQHFSSKGFSMIRTSRRSGQHGPDFCIDYEGQRIWIEAIVPSPEGIPAEWLYPEPNKIVARTKPHREMLLRCTHAIAVKRDKIANYQEKGTIGEKDQTVIAINICRLSDWDVDGNGVSKLPFAVEAVFPIGPLAFSVSRDGKVSGPAQNLSRFTVQKENGTEIPTYAFLDTKFKNISAVFQGHQKDCYRRELVLSVVHNPLALNKLSVGMLGGHREFVAEPDGDGYLLSDISNQWRDVDEA
jgi:type I restriction enzyme S subunit